MSDGTSAARREILVVAALTLLPLLPFLGKAFSLDVPLELAVAQQVIAHPLDPMGFDMEWDPTSAQLAVFYRNPPLLAYYLAPWIALFGENEILLHVLVLPFPLLAALSFHGIARRLCSGGLAPTVLLVTTPAFVFLAATLLLDVPMQACWLLAVWALLRGREPGGEGWQWLAGCAAAAAGLLKYVGMATAPLLAIGALWLLPRPGRATLRLLLPPLLAWGAWGAWSAALYGTPHFFGAGEVTSRVPQLAFWWTHLASVPAYHGLALVFPVALWLTRLARNGPALLAAVAALFVACAVAVWVLPAGVPARRHPMELEEQVLAVLGGAGAIFAWILVFGRGTLRAGPEERFLGLWLAGVLVFAFFVNWHVKASDALLAAPPLLLLLFRRGEIPAGRWVAGCAALALPLAMAVAGAEAVQANFHRQVAAEIGQQIGAQPGARWQVGHWGFQHYLSRQGFQALPPEARGPAPMAAGDWLAAPRNVSQIDISGYSARHPLEHVRTWECRSWLPLRANNPDAGAGFYSHRIGYLPFAIHRGPVEEVQLGRVLPVR